MVQPVSKAAKVEHEQTDRRVLLALRNLPRCHEEFHNRLQQTQNDPACLIEQGTFLVKLDRVFQVKKGDRHLVSKS